MGFFKINIGCPGNSAFVNSSTFLNTLNVPGTTIFSNNVGIGTNNSNSSLDFYSSTQLQSTLKHMQAVKTHY